MLVNDSDALHDQGLFRHSTFSNALERIPDYLVSAHSRLIRTVQDAVPRFPCFFARTALKTDDFFFFLLDDYRSAEPLGAALMSFLALKKTDGRRPVLAVFERSLANVFDLRMHEAAFWVILQQLHDIDAMPWPSSVPTAPSDPKWSFCFAGTPVFVNGHSSNYTNRRSRYSADGLMLIIQRLDNLDEIVGGSTRASEVRSRIRGDLVVYDGMPPAAALGAKPADLTWDWRQYWLPDLDSDTGAACPLRIRGAQEIERN